MAQIIDNSHGRRMIKLSVDDILMIVSMYQQKCNSKNLNYGQIRDALSKEHFYLPEDVTSLAEYSTPY